MCLLSKLLAAKLAAVEARGFVAAVRQPVERPPKQFPKVG